MHIFIPSCIQNHIFLLVWNVFSCKCNSFQFFQQCLNTIFSSCLAKNICYAPFLRTHNEALKNCYQSIETILQSYEQNLYVLLLPADSPDGQNNRDNWNRCCFSASILHNYEWKTQNKIKQTVFFRVRAFLF